MATEKVIRSMWAWGVREAERQISRIFSGLVSLFRRERAVRVLDLEEGREVEKLMWWRRWGNWRRRRRRANSAISVERKGGD